MTFAKTFLTAQNVVELWATPFELLTGVAFETPKVTGLAGNAGLEKIMS